MDRTNIFAAHDDRRITGWFDWDAIKGRWSDRDHNNNGSGGRGRGEEVILTAGGKWVMNHWTAWQGESSTRVYMTADAARDWLLRNEEDSAVEEYFGELAEEEDRRPGRPEIGDPVQVRFHSSQLARIDAYAGSAGIKRAEAIRQLAEIALLDAESRVLPPVTDEQVSALRDEAGQAGDREQVAICDAALAGDASARATCADVIASAAAMGD